jgi:Tfp pilus assembly protein PilZ
VVFKHVRNLKAVVDTVPLLVIGKAEQLELRNRIANVVHTLVLERPYTDKDLSGLVNTIFGPGTIYQREHRRFSTAQPAFVEVYGKNVESESMMLNLSRGGAYVELPNTDEIVIGDLMRLMIDLDEMKTNYRMHAKVVWAGGPTRAGHRGFGVEFIRPGDVFREMQNR